MLGVKERIGIRIDRDEVRRYLGCPAGRKMPARMSSLLNEYLENVNHLVDASYSYVIKDIEFVHGSFILLEDLVVFESKVLAKLLERCEMVAVFALTIGDRLEKMVGKLSEDGLVLQATVLDAIGSCAAEQLAVSVEDMIREIVRLKGLSISRRFSPGYCDWDVSQQEMIFRVLNCNSAGVSLSGEYLMLPRKSISGIIGIGNSSIENYNPCKTCLKQDCPGRRE